MIMIADDLTGALDTCVQFVKQGASAALVSAYELQNLLKKQDLGYDIIVVNAETRHMSDQGAYETVYALISQICAMSAESVYIKTDSGLRGRIGSSLQAALDAGGKMFIPFLPALPSMNRVTKGGIQWIDGLPIHQSVYGLDPFDPIRSPYVRDLFADQKAAAFEFSAEAAIPQSFDLPAVGIFDSESHDDFRAIAEKLKKNDQLSIVAGCAGFASELSKQLIPAPKLRKIPKVSKDKPLLIICGSLSAVSERQMDAAEELTAGRVVLSPRQLLFPDYFESSEGKKWITELIRLHSGKSVLIIETGFKQKKEVMEFGAGLGLDINSLRDLIPVSLGAMVKRMQDMGKLDCYTLCIIGGDTAMGCMRSLNWQAVYPAEELLPGAVLSSVSIPGGSINMITKSGSFGEEYFVERLREKLSDSE